MLGRIIEPDVDTGFVYSLAKLVEGRNDSLRRVFECVLSYVRCTDYAFDSPAFFVSHKVGGTVSIFLSVVDSGHKVTMDIGMEKQLRFFLCFFLEKVKHKTIDVVKP